MVSVLSALSDNGAGFVEAAYTELRRALVQGRLVEAGEVGGTIAIVLEVQEGGVEDELAENRIHRESLRWLIEGIGAILGQDTVTGIAFLENLTGAVYSNESLQWVAWHWVARAAAEAGDLNMAQVAAREACELGERLDAQAASASLLTIGDIKILRGEYDKALQHLSQAGQTFEEIGDRRGLAATWLARARAHAAAGDWGLGHGAAAWAAEIDADWPDPVVYLARQAMISDDLDEAEQVLTAMTGRDKVPLEVQRELYNLARLRDGTVDRELYKRHLELQEQLPSDEVVEELRGIVDAHADYHQVRELLAWNLAKLSRDDEARKEFEHLSGESLAPHLQSSVLLGLGCLANRANLHRQPGVRVAAAATARSTSEIQAATIQRPVKSPVAYAPSPEEAADDVPPPEDEAEDVPPPLVEDDDDLPPPVDELELPPAVDGGAAGAAPKHHINRFKPDEQGAAPPPATVEPSAKAVFTGTLQLFAVPDLLEFLRSSRRTGTLVVTSEYGIGAVHMSDGRLTGGASPSSTNLGDLLLEQETITEEQLKDAALRQKKESPDHLLGAILVETGVDRDAVRSAIGKQIHQAILEMISWTDGHFAFEPDRSSTKEFDGEVVVELDTQGVLLEVLRQFDEANR